MFVNLTQALAEVLHLGASSDLLTEADIVFDRPGDSFQARKNSINLFLFDVRERTDLRSSEPVIERAADGTVASITPAPMRMACSYLVTAWIDAGQSGEDASLAEQGLLANALEVFAAMPALSHPKLSDKAQAWLSQQAYPVELVVLQSTLMNNLSEFWSAVGGSLRLSFTLTATVTMAVKSPAQKVALVTRKEIVINRPEAAPSVATTARPAKRSNRR